ncbi:uncharacterized protein Dana_GF23764, isoform A [Drosophila ananassae]|uniref:Uncharacterized protein, isoform A n=1 Tax=Drosophila ananassae TaxID=7217 RepID=B3MVN3_DROAN|nr:general transcriptional corepressor trfA isoform X2 [Drosophila ananassae]EDV33298.2 uncharacterized protein Dana_GF23764, isoform A [Drosophila ananassae]
MEEKQAKDESFSPVCNVEDCSSSLEASSLDDQKDVPSIPLPVDETAKSLVIGIVEEVICLTTTTMKGNEADNADIPEPKLSPDNPDLQPEENSNGKKAVVGEIEELNRSFSEKVDSQPKESNIAELLEPKLSFNENPEAPPEEENEKKADISNPECSPTKTDNLGNESLDETAFSKDLLSSTILKEKENDMSDTTLTPEKTANKPEESFEKAEQNELLESGELQDSTLEPGQLSDKTIIASKGSDLEDGEVSGGDDDVKSNPTDVFQADVPICRFYVRSACTWGRNCRFRHPEPTPKGKYQMFENKVLPVATSAPLPPTWSGFIPPSVDPYQPERLARPRQTTPSPYCLNDMDTDPYYSHNQIEVHERAPLLPTPTFTYVAPPQKILHYPVEMERSIRREPAPPPPPPPPPPKQRPVVWESRHSSSSPSSTTLQESPTSSSSLLISPPRCLHSARRPSVIRKPSPYRRTIRPEPKRRRLSSSSSSSSTTTDSGSSNTSREIKSKESRKRRSNNSTSRHRERHSSRTPVHTSSKRATPGAPKKSRLEDEKSESAKKKQSRQEYLLMKLLKVEKQIAKKKEQNRTLKSSLNKF